MKFNIVDIMLVLTFMLPIIIACSRKFNMSNIKISLLEIGKYISLFISIYLSFYVIRNCSLAEKAISLILANTSHLIDKNNNILHLIVITIFAISILAIYFIITLIFTIINKFFLLPLLKTINKLQVKRGVLFKKVLAIFLAIPKSVFYTLLLWFIITIVGSSNVLGENVNKYVSNSKAYRVIESKAKIYAFKKEINNSIVEETISTSNSKVDENNIKHKQNVINLYNGITLEEGIKSNKEIEDTARELARNIKDDRKKAKIIYKWIGTNIKYDDEKAKELESNSGKYKSGAIATFQSKKGVCFDYSCLYVAMAKAVGLDARIVTGEAYNGEMWGPHAWNEVYLKEENKWISVDSTFYSGGNYFDSSNFNKFHKNRKLVE